MTCLKRIRNLFSLHSSFSISGKQNAFKWAKRSFLTSGSLCPILLYVNKVMFKIQICFSYQHYYFGIINHFLCVENKIQVCTDYQLPLTWKYTNINAKMPCPGNNCKFWFMGLYFEMFWSSNSLTIKNKIILCTHFDKICITLNMVRKILMWVLRYQWRIFF